LRSFACPEAHNGIPATACYNWCFGRPVGSDRSVLGVEESEGRSPSANNEVFVRVKVLLCAVVACAALGACKKGPAAQTAASAATPPAATGQGSGTPPVAPAPPAPPKPVPAELPAIVARVNGEDVKKEEFERMIKTLESRAGQPIPPDRRDEILRGALDQLVVYTLLSQEVKSRGIKVDDKEIDAKMQQLRGQFPTQEAFEKALKDRGMTADGLRKDARVDLSVTKLMEAEVAALPGPSDVEAKDFYGKNPDKFKEPERARASHILVRVDEKADAAAKAKAKATIDTVLKKAKGGEDFGKLAQQYSQDGSAAQGGDLGEFPRGQMVPAFEQAAFALKPGEISGIVTTQFGYHVIKLIEVKPGRTVPFEEAVPQIKQFLEGQKKQQHADAFIDGLKKKSKIEVLI
jgi:peptidyl-prolyl cis-trans isomerase C